MSWRGRAGAAAAAAVVFVLALFAAPAFALPDITLDKQAPGTVLYGENAPVTLTRDEPVEPAPDRLQPRFRDVLPAGREPRRPGSASVAPSQVIANAPAPGQTTLIWSNVADLPPGVTQQISYQVAHDPAVWDVGETYTNQASAYVNSDPRLLPRLHGHWARPSPAARRAARPTARTPS